jgi:hypothetical protein
VIVTYPVGEHSPHITFPIQRDGCEVMVTLQLLAEDGEMVCGLRFVQGEMPLPPKALRKAMLEELGRIEAIAKAAGVKEMRHAGLDAREDLAVFLPGYEPMADRPNWRRKRL